MSGRVAATADWRKSQKT
uniref:Uncharacterized protein n=1 Tax=Arundo donax TaxID=35708 RepID=A0A0A9FSX5_ARUDO